MWLCTMAMLRVHSAIGQYPLANNDAIPHSTDVIRLIFQQQGYHYHQAGLDIYEGCGLRWESAEGW
jgi:hypothetical protein